MKRLGPFFRQLAEQWFSRQHSSSSQNTPVLFASLQAYSSKTSAEQSLASLCIFASLVAPMMSMMPGSPFL